MTTQAPPPAASANTSRRVGGPAAITVWAGIGSVVVALVVFTVVAWIVSGDARRTSTGIDPVPGATKTWAVGVQAALSMGALITIGWATRSCRRAGGLTPQAILVLAWPTLWWQDPLPNLVRPVFFYNSYLVNFGSWAGWIPGWASPRGRLFPEPLLAIFPLYFTFCVGATLVAAAIMRRAHARWPHFGVVRLCLVAYVPIAAFDVVVESIFTRSGLYAWAGVVRWASIWGGQRHQFPVYAALLTAPIMIAMAALLVFRDANGASIVERGADRIVGPKRRTGMRVLAFVGFLHVVTFVGYIVPMNVVALHVDETPSGYPTYMRNGLCGEGTPDPCPGPALPVPTRTSYAAIDRAPWARRANSAGGRGVTTTEGW